MRERIWITCIAPHLAWHWFTVVHVFTDEAIISPTKHGSQVPEMPDSLFQNMWTDFIKDPVSRLGIFKHTVPKSMT